MSKKIESKKIEHKNTWSYLNNYRILIWITDILCEYSLLVNHYASFYFK